MSEPLSKRTLIAGIGSPHGDDRIGWLIVDELRRLEPNWNAVRLATPAELLDRLASVERLIVCDACQGSGPVGSFRIWRWPSPELKEARFVGTHDLGLIATLELAATLGWLPGQVWVWGRETGPALFGGGYSAGTSPLAWAVAHALRAFVVDLG